MSLRYKLAIFDWNGTLIDDTFANLAGANATFRAAGVPEVSLERYRDTMDFPLVHTYARNGIDADTYLKNIEMFNNAFLDVYRLESRNAPLRHGAMDVLDTLLDKGITLMILSNHIQEHLEEQLAERHVHHKFKHICGNPVFKSEQITRLTKLDRLKKIMDEHGYKPEESFIIGDSLEEPEIGQHMGMHCVSVTWGCFSADRLRKSPTHHVIDEMVDLLPFLGIKPPTKRTA